MGEQFWFGFIFGASAMIVSLAIIYFTIMFRIIHKEEQEQKKHDEMNQRLEDFITG